MCNQCVIANEDMPAEARVRDEKLKRCLTKGMRRMLNFEEITENKTKCIAILNNRAKLDFNVSIYVKDEIKTFLVRVDEQILQQLGTSSLDFSTLDYIDITKQIKQPSKSSKPQQLMFAIEDVSILA